MLLFSTVLNVNETLTKDDFIRLVITWNQGSPHSENVIPGIEWHGEHNIRFGDDRMWLDIQEYRNGNTIAVRYEKTEEDGVVWDTDYVMNFTEMKISIRLDRSYLADALTVDPKFSTPHFISLLSKGGYLKPDDNLPVSNLPIHITDENLGIICSVINGIKQYRMPVVYISKTFANTDPVDVSKLSSRLKGVAHVLVQENKWLNRQIREMCKDMNEYGGAVGIYFPNPAVPHKRYFYRAYDEFDSILMEKVVRTVINYANAQNVNPLYTWQGVDRALFRDRWSSRGEDLIALEREKKHAESAQEIAEKARAEAEREKDEANQLVDSTDHEIAALRRQIENLTHDNERLIAENTGLRSKINSIDSMPIIFLGSEDEFFPGEIKDIILSVLEKSIGKDAKSRRADVLRDIIESNGYQHLQDDKSRELKAKLKGYKTMNSPLRRYLEALGFVITEEGKHYRMTYFGDSRYHTTLSKTSSDWREGENAAAQIIRDML